MALVGDGRDNDQSESTTGGEDDSSDSDWKSGARSPTSQNTNRDAGRADDSLSPDVPLPTKEKPLPRPRTPAAREKEVGVGQGLVAVANALASGIAVEKMRDEVKVLSTDLAELRRDVNAKFDSILAAVAAVRRDQPGA